MLDLFITVAAAEFGAYALAFLLIGLILAALKRWLPPVVPTDEDEIVGDGSTLRREVLCLRTPVALSITRPGVTQP